MSGDVWHRLAEQRSLEYHRLVAERLRSDPQILRHARERVAQWVGTGTEAPHYARAWERILGGSVEAVAGFLISTDETAVELRQSSPFAGVLSARERWQIWRQVREAESTA